MSKIVERTLDFFELFAEHKRPLSLSEISRLLNIPASSCHDVLHALEARNFIYEVGPRGGYYPTMRISTLADTIARHDPILVRAEAELSRICKDLDESVFLSKASGTKVTYLLVIEASHPLRFLVSVGAEVRSLHATSAGRAFLGSLSPAEFKEYLSPAKLKPMTGKTIVSKELLEKEIERGRKRGFHINREESVEGATTISTAFVWNRSTYIVTVAGPSARMVPKLERSAKLVMDACRRIEQGGLSSARPKMAKLA